MTGIQKVGFATVLLSFFLGVLGAASSISATFLAQTDAEYAALETIGDVMTKAILFTILAIAGPALGIALIVVGRQR